MTSLHLKFNIRKPHNFSFRKPSSSAGSLNMTVNFLTSLLFLLFLPPIPIPLVLLQSGATAFVILPSHCPSSSSSLKHAKGSSVEVRIERSLPVPPPQARDAWWQHLWSHGGGLPVRLDSSRQERWLLPMLLQEKMLPSHQKHEIRYKVTDFGLLKSDLVTDSHSSSVNFIPQGDGTTMVWQVNFDTRHRQRFWQAVTQFAISTAADTVVRAVATPRLFTRTLTLTNTNVNKAKDAFVNFVWNQGGGLPIPPLIRLSDQRRMILPTCLIETMTRVGHDEIEYIVENPGLFTFPVYTYRGRVHFQQLTSDTVKLLWQTEARPFPGCVRIVETFAQAVITTLTRNLAVHLAEPNAVVRVSPPRGKGTSFASVPKDTWLGGVLEAHLRDSRSTWEQTLSMFQPWTWGRARDDPNDHAVTEWSNGYLQ